MRLIDADALEKWMKRDDWGTPDERWRPESEFGAIIDAQPTVGGWISVKERLPEKGGEYLVCFLFDFDSKPHYDVLDFNEKGKFFEICGSGWFQSNGIYGTITHWMHLPEPPEEMKGEEK